MVPLKFEIKNTFEIVFLLKLLIETIYLSTHEPIKIIHGVSKVD